MKDNKKILNITTFILSIVFIGFIMCCVGYSLDDWAWGASVGEERLSAMFAGYNGRYLGNFLVIIMSKYNIIKILIMTLFTVVTAYSVYRLVDKSKFYLYFTALLLLFFMPKEMFSQTLGWASGFSNYVPPIMLSVIYLCIIKNIFETQKPVYNKFMPILTLLIGISSNLFMENVTLFNLALGFVVIVFTYIRFKKVYITHSAFLLGAVIGSVIMFSNSAYRIISSGSDDYRSIGGDDTSLLKTVFENLKLIYKFLFEQCLMLWIIICIAALILSFLHLKNNKPSKVNRFLTLLSSSVILSFAVISVLTKMNTQWTEVFNSANEGFAAKVNFVLAGLVLLALFITPLLCINDKLSALKTASFIGLACVVTAPLFVITPINSRCLFSAYVFLAVYAISIINQITSSLNYSFVKNLAALLLTAACFITAFYYGTLYHRVHSFYNERIEYVYEQIDENKKEIDLPKYPKYITSYVYFGTPSDDTMWEERFKDFYNIDEKINFTPVNYRDYKEKYNK